MPKLGINIDHVATIRQARGGLLPSPVEAAILCEKSGAHSIVAHLREDRRHIQDKDLFFIKKRIKKRFNLEMSISPDIVNIALKIVPSQATLVPEKRKELTTEGGLNVIKNFQTINKVVAKLSQKKILVSLFIDPSEKQILAAKRAGAHSIEIHTGRYADAPNLSIQKVEFNKIKDSVLLGKEIGLIVNAGHGLNYVNTKKIAKIPGIHELNIGHSIISRAIFSGLEKAVKDMLHLIK